MFDGQRTTDEEECHAAAPAGSTLEGGGWRHEKRSGLLRIENYMDFTGTETEGDVFFISAVFLDHTRERAGYISARGRYLIEGDQAHITLRSLRRGNDRPSDGPNLETVPGQ